MPRHRRRAAHHRDREAASLAEWVTDRDNRSAHPQRLLDAAGLNPGQRDAVRGILLLPHVTVGVQGHRDPATTLKYTHMSDAFVREAVDIVGAALEG